MKKYIVPGILLLLADILVCYLTLPVLSVHNIGFWFLLFINYVCIYLMIVVIKRKELKKALTIPNVILVAMVLFLIIGSLLSSTMVNAKAYRNILNVQTDDRSSLPDETEISSIPLMDTESSKILGNRKIGALNEIVSQFEVSDDYMTIAYRNEPVKVSALRYASFWKWAVNRSNGIPGYILVRPNDLTAEYVKLEKGMTIVPSGYFNEDIRRFIYLHYPTVFFESPHLELDENGKIYYVAPTYTYSIGLFGGKTITGCILVDPVERTIERYRSNEMPEWVDIVYNGDYIAEYFDVYGKLVNGFWNSKFGQKGLIESTTTTVYDSDGDAHRDHDFGYLVRDNDVYIYTGVTAVTNDESNIGYILANERTGETKLTYFESTDEDSVMRAAEGEVQEKGYRASFPSLLNINGSPAYVMVLKDKLGLVKMYAIVNASQYSHMVVEDSLQKALNTYTKGNVSVSDMTEKTVTVARIELVTSEGNTLVYLVDTDKNIYVSDFFKEALLIGEGDTVTIMTDGTLFKVK